jgi:hypothetical protein
MISNIYLQARIHHKEGSFIVSRESLQINGFTSNSLENGRPFVAVKQELIKLLDEKLVITCNGAADFKSLDINLGDVESFELQNVYQKWNGGYTKHGEKVYQPLGLKRSFDIILVKKFNPKELFIQLKMQQQECKFLKKLMFLGRKKT